MITQLLQKTEGHTTGKSARKNHDVHRLRGDQDDLRCGKTETHRERLGRAGCAWVKAIAAALFDVTWGAWKDRRPSKMWRASPTSRDAFATAASKHSRCGCLLLWRNDRIHQRFGCFCHSNAVGRFTGRAISGFSKRRKSVERENSSVESTLSLSGVHRLSTNFRCWRKKKRCVRKCRKIERESQGEEKRSDDHDHVDGVRDSSLEPRCVCRWCDTVRQTRLCALRSCGCQWKWCRWCSHRAVPRNHGCCHWCPRHAVPRNHRCCHWRPRHAWSPSNHVPSTIMNFPLLVPILILLSDCINSSSLVPVAILCTLLHRENTSFEVWYLHHPRLQ